MDCITLLVFVLCTLTAEVNCEDTCRQLEFRSALSFQGKRLINHAIKTVESVFKDFCGALCFMEPNCVSYNMELRSPTITNCELNNSTHFEYPIDLKPWKNYTYRGSKINACGKKPCENHGTCQTGFTNKGYRCVCSPEFKGHDCTEDVDECASASHKCHANADCGNTHGSYNCTCKPGYTGDGHNCTDIDDCASHPCANNGTCTDRVNGFNCSCAPGFNGTQCEIDIDDCASHPCKNNGTCADRVNGFNCSCAPGFNGLQCETDIDDCASHPCKYNGTCTDRQNGFSCSCPPGFSGTRCETVVCPQYINLTDADRKYGPDTTGSLKCDDELDDWYRFHGDAGRKMMTTCPSVNKCGGKFTAWLNDSHPTVAQGSVIKKVCIRKSEPGDCCFDFYFAYVKSCGSYFIYRLLRDQFNCYYRYCGTD